MSKQMTKTKGRRINADNDAYFSSHKAPGPLPLEVGDRVSYTRYFLKCIMMPPTDDMWHQRGVVIKVEGTFARIKWDGEDEPRSVLTNNLARPGPNLRFCE